MRQTNDLEYKIKQLVKNKYYRNERTTNTELKAPDFVQSHK